MARSAAGGAPEPGITVAVGTRDRPHQLRRALRSLLEQSVAPGEILVIDNAPSGEATRQLVAGEFPTLRYIYEPVPGLDFARNRALEEATCGIVAFLDDDAVADPDWVSETARVFALDATVGACTGKVDALSLEHPGQRLFEANGGFARGDRRIHLPRDADGGLHGMPAPLVAWSISVGSGCSLAVRRNVVLEMGGFDEALDLGPELPGGGDLDILWRLLTAGWEVVYEPRVHALHEHRREADAALLQIAEHNRALIATLTKSVREAGGRERWTTLAFLGWRLLKPGVRLARRVAGRDPLPVPALLRLWSSCWRGLAAYPRAVRVARLRRERYG